MPQRSLFMLIGAIGLGLLAVLVMRFYIGAGGSTSVTAVAEVPRPVRVAVAATPLPSGTKLDATNVKFVDYAPDTVPAGALHTLAEIGDNRTTVSAVVPGEALLASRLSGPGNQATIAAQLDPGMRAATVHVTDVTGTGGFILPGSHVDLLVTLTPPGSGAAGAVAPTPITDLLAQNVRVIAINQESDQAKDKPQVAQTVTLEVTPQLGQKLALAQSVGTVSLVLRNPANAAPESLATVHVGDLRDGRATAPMVVRAAVRRAPAHRAAVIATSTVEVVRGVERTSYTVARSGQ